MTAEELIGQTVGPYTIEKMVGSGGMSVVYRARSPQGKVVALKVLFPPPDTGAETLARFEREARTAADLSHPSLVPVLDTGQADRRAYLVMPFIAGQTLADRLAKVERLDEASAADIAWQVADALYYAHSRGIVHRDIKPSNILLTDDGRALLTDFGVAQALDDPALTRTGYTVGTPAYMSPEQAAGDRLVDGRSDLYSLGVVLYQMVTGRLPFQGGTPQMLHAHVYTPPPAPSTIAEVSPGLEAVILRALAKDPAARFQTGAAMAQALNDLEDQTGSQLQAVAAAVQGKKNLLARPILWVIPLVVVLAAMGAMFWQFSEDMPATPTATIPPIVSFSTSLPTDTPRFNPSPAHTPTLPPTPTPQPSPTLSPTPVAPTATPLPPTPTPAPAPTVAPTEPPSFALDCAQPAGEALTGLTNSAFSRQLGCPRTEAITTNAAWQPFEQGRLLWREDRRLIYILRADNSWDLTADRWEEGEPEPAPTALPPDDLHLPVRGFGSAWREENLLPDIGWGLAGEVGFTATIQEFDNGTVWHNPDAAWFVILFNNSTHQIVDEATLEAE